jgi:hypothetical protein
MAERSIPKPFPAADELPDYDPDELRDPDWDHAPEGLEARDGKPVHITAVDANGELVHTYGVMTPLPGVHGDLHRRRD